MNVVNVPRPLKLEPQELAPFLWALICVLALFMAYYLLRPIRDEWGIAAGVRNLPWLFTATLLAMLALAPLFAQAVRTLPRKRFIALSYRFFALQLLGFAVGFALLGTSDDAVHASDNAVWNIWLGRAFFVWLSVFNLFAVSLFWSLMVDVFTADAGKRLFGPLAAGATAGGMVGAGVTALLAAQHVSGVWLMLLAALLLEVAVQAAGRLQGCNAPAPPPGQEVSTQHALGGSLWAGLTHMVRKPYLAGIALFILLYSTTSTLLYFQQADIVQAHFSDRAARVAFFARMDLLVNTCTLALQVFAASRLMGLREKTDGGVILTLCLLPLASVVAFGALALYPTLAALVAAQALRRIANFAFAKPARELLFTRASREDRYKAKNVMDTAIYRGGDQVGSWAWAGMTALGLALAHVAWVAVALSAAWLALALWLGRMWQRVAQPPS